MAAPVSERRILGVRRLVFIENLWFYLFISPWIIGFLVFTAGPMVASIAISFMRWELISPPEFVGLSNWKAMFSDDLFWQSLKVTSIYTLLNVPTALTFAFLLALLMNVRVPGIAFFRTLYYLPSLVSGVAVAMLWMWILNPKFGLINWLLSFVGIQGPEWIYSQTWVIPSFVMMNLWGVGTSMVIFLAGLQSVPMELYEAAELDGAGSWRKMWNVTIPIVSPVILFNLIMGIIGSFQVFTQAYVMTEGGPGNASLFYVLYLYRNAFQYFQMGYASALAWVLFIIIAFFTYLVFRTSRDRVFYQM
ncbi:MAG TPA: sugar ABC transporter permease [Caldilineaceae bacterium]|nr:sugar ABC transporter permease [Caldilineaceae bacterium]